MCGPCWVPLRTFHAHWLAEDQVDKIGFGVKQARGIREVGCWQLSNFTFHLLSVNQKQQFLCPSNEQGESEREWGPIHDPGRCPWEPETCRNSQGLPHPSMTSTFTSHPSADLEKPALSLMSGHFSLLHALTSPWQPLMSISQRAGAGSLIQEFTTVNPGPPRSNHTHCFRHLTP